MTPLLALVAFAALGSVVCGLVVRLAGWLARKADAWIEARGH